jgi:spore germination cell wall hydrolase CwlJ-like protein
MRILTILVCLLATAFSVAQQTSVASHDYYLVEEDSLYYSEVEEWTEQEQCLIETIYFEARGEPFLGQVGVGVVVMRRVQSDKFPDNICDVVHDGVYWKGNPVRNRCAFSYFCDGKSETMLDEEGYFTAIEAAKLVLMGIVLDNMENVVYYHATYVNPSWAKHKKRAFQIGKHIFYKEK